MLGSITTLSPCLVRSRQERVRPASACPAASLGSREPSYISCLGTLLNRLFGTTFDVMDETKRQQTTKGLLAQCIRRSPLTRVTLL